MKWQAEFNCKNVKQNKTKKTKQNEKPCDKKSLNSGLNYWVFLKVDA